MKTSTILHSVLLGALCLAGPAAVAAQDKSKATTQKLIEQLGAPDYEARKSAEKQLLQRGEASLEALKKSAERHDDPEIQWRAGRLVQRIQSGSKAEGKTLGKRDRGADRAPGRVEGKRVEPGDRSERRRATGDVLERLDRVFEGREFDGDVRKELDRVMEQLRKSMRGMDLGGGVEFGPGQGRSFKSDNNRSMKMQQGPDGVRVEITETGKDGKPKTKVYEAKDMESFKKKHPGVLGNDSFRFGFEGFPSRGGFRVFGPDAFPNPFRRGGQWIERGDEKGSGKKELRRQRDRKPVEEPRKPEGRKFGFHVGEISPAIRAYLGLRGGLMVADVVEGSTAARLGLRQGDIVTKVGNRTIQDVSDVAEALEEIGDGKVTVGIIRRGRELTLKD